MADRRAAQQALHYLQRLIPEGVMAQPVQHHGNDDIVALCVLQRHLP